MRQLAKNKNIPTYGVFTARGKDSSRLEQLSDCVFALAITMSLFSTVSPKNFDQLMLFMSDLVPFGLSILFVIWIWYGHYQFFIRFGLRDMRIITLNTVLMIIVLFFVYPLKFLSTWLVTYFTLLFKSMVLSRDYLREMNQTATEMIPWHKMPQLMITYDLGFLAIFIVFILMYRHALSKKNDLDLSAIEIHTSRYIMAHYIGVACVSVLSLCIALSGYIANWAFAGMFAGIVYFLIGPVSYFIGVHGEKKLKALTSR